MSAIGPGDLVVCVEPHAPSGLLDGRTTASPGLDTRLMLSAGKAQVRCGPLRRAAAGRRRARDVRVACV